MLTSARPAKDFQTRRGAIFAAPEAALGQFKDLDVERIARSAGGLDLDAVMQALAAREINEVLVECGATLAGSVHCQATGR